MNASLSHLVWTAIAVFAVWTMQDLLSDAEAAPAAYTMITGTVMTAQAQVPSPFGPPPGSRQSGQVSPFAAPGSGAAGPAIAPSESFGVAGRFWLWVQQTQTKLHQDLVSSVRNLKQQHSLLAGSMLALVSFIYGVVHAIGPGHGKAVISSYVLANERTLRRGVILAFLSSVVQACSAIAIVVIFSLLMRAAGLKIQAAVGQLETVSYALVAAIGAWMMYMAIRRHLPRLASARQSLAAEAAHNHAHDRGHDHHHHDHHHHEHGPDCGCGHAHVPDPAKLGEDFSWRRAIPIIFAVGIRPCTGAILVLVFALTQGLFWAGIASTFAMALGTAITVSALAVMAVGSRGLAVRLSGGDSVWAGRIEGLAAIGGSFLVFLLGVALFAGSLGPAKPFAF